MPIAISGTPPYSRARGEPPIGERGLGERGERVSALCSFDVNGFVAWEYTNGTYDRAGFLSASERVIVRVG